MLYMTHRFKVIVLTVVIVVALSASGSIAGIIAKDNMEFSITYVLNDGVNSEDNPTSYKSSDTVTFTDPQKDGFIFTGWYLDPELTQEIDTIDKGSKKNLTLYAAWQKSLVGTELIFDISGSIVNDSNQSNWYISGTMTGEYVDHKKDKGYQISSYQAVDVDRGTSNYRKADKNTYWENDNANPLVLNGNDTITTIYGKMNCEVWERIGDTKTEYHYVGDDNITYRMELTDVNGSITTTFRYELIGINDPDMTNITKNYTWVYKNIQYNISLNISFKDFVDCRADDIARYQVTNDWNRHDLSFVTYNDKYIKQIANQINELSDGLSEANKAGMILAFTQYLKYRYDSNSVGFDEYWKYPVETLVDGEGDCEDTSILFCALAKYLGYDCCLIFFNGHMAAGVVLHDFDGEGKVNIKGTDDFYYVFDEKHYYYCETTNVGYVIGTNPLPIYDEYHVLRHAIVI